MEILTVFALICFCVCLPNWMKRMPSRQNLYCTHFLNINMNSTYLGYEVLNTKIPTIKKYLEANPCISDSAVHPTSPFAPQNVMILNFVCTIHILIFMVLESITMIQNTLSQFKLRIIGIIVVIFLCDLFFLLLNIYTTL